MSAGQLARLRWGLAAALGMALVAWPVWGGVGARAAAVFAGLATLIQLVAARIAGRMGKPATPDHLAVYLSGMLLRFGGVGLIGLAVWLRRGDFPPLPTAAGYLGAMLPLLYLETRLGR